MGPQSEESKSRKACFSFYGSVEDFRGVCANGYDVEVVRNRLVVKSFKFVVRALDRI